MMREKESQKGLDTECHVLDLDFPYNILLGRPWIHTLEAVPSTYHRCLKFPYQGREVKIPRDPTPFEFCRRLEGTPANLCPISEFATIIHKPLTIQEPPSTIVLEIANEHPNSHKGKEKVEDTKVSTTGKKVTFAYLGLGEYKFENALCVGENYHSPLVPLENLLNYHLLPIRKLCELAKQHLSIGVHLVMSTWKIIS